jgi:RHS repeat-associated protein
MADPVWAFRISFNARGDFMGLLTAFPRSVVEKQPVMISFRVDDIAAAVAGLAATVYVGSQYEKQGSTVVKYYLFGGQRVAMNKGGVLYYLAGDHLGTTSAVLCGQAAGCGTVPMGGKVAESRHHPYGTQRWASGTFPTDYRFTGQRVETGLGGIYHMGARFYDPALARWLSADTLVPDPKNPQSLNRYSYVRNSPLNFTDPTGHREDGECGPIGGDCIDVSALWDQYWLQFVGDPEAAEQAFLLFLANPQYFASLYTNPAAWAGSQEVAELDVFLQYSVLHTEVGNFMASLFDPDTASSIMAAHMLHGMGDEAGANDLLAAAGFGVGAAACTVFTGGSYSSTRAPGMHSSLVGYKRESSLLWRRTGDTNGTHRPFQYGELGTKCRSQGLAPTTGDSNEGRADAGCSSNGDP